MPRKPLSSVWAALLIVLFAALNAGCSKKSDTVTGPGTTTLPSVAAASDSARIVVLDTLDAVIAALPGNDPAADRQTLIQFIKTCPQFAASGVSLVGNVWARFQDGRLMIIENSVQPEVTSGFGRKGGGGLPQLGDGVAKKTFETLPGQANARIMNALGTAFPDCQTAALNIRSWCSTAGYTLSTPNDPTVDNLKGVSGDGIFFLVAHGGAVETSNGEFVDAVSTSSPVLLLDEPKYKDDLDKSRLCYFRASQNAVFNTKGGPLEDWRYGITMFFVKDYMSFASNSLVFVNACSSTNLADAFIYKNAGMYLGWSAPVRNGQANQAARFFFDRALGTNKATPKETPPQRPFPTYDVFQDLVNHGYDVSTTDAGPSRLLSTPYPLPALLLAPSISFTIILPVPGSPLYKIGGVFGDDPGSDGKVMLYNTSLPTMTWATGGIQMKVPPAGGNLFVSVRGIQSNWIQVTQWKGQFDYTLVGPGTLKEHIVWNVNFVADVHSVRFTIASKPLYFMPRPIGLLSSSTCTYECSGDTLDDEKQVVESWSGSGSVPQLVTGSEPAWYMFMGSIDSTNGGSTQLQPTIFGTFDRWTMQDGTTQEKLMSTDFGTLTPVVTSGFVIKGDKLSATDGSFTATLSWPDLSPLYPPDPNGAR